jgi:hypothetical protein
MKVDLIDGTDSKDSEFIMSDKLGPSRLSIGSVTIPARSNARTRRKSWRIPGTIARDLGVQIVSGRFKPGHKLNGEIETSGRLRVSRTAYRGPVRILTAKGLVKALPKVGTRVSPQVQWHLLDPQCPRLDIRVRT